MRAAKRSGYLVIVLAAVLAACAPIEAARTRVLTVSLYPVMPAATEAYWELKKAYEARHPAVTLNVIINPDYYDNYPGPGAPGRGVLFDQADVFQIDTVLLGDFVARGKLAPIPAHLQTLAPIVAGARNAATLGGVAYGVPHWMCGNFLIHRRGDAAMAGVKTLADLEAALRPVAKRGLAADFTGKWTLGELYIDALMDGSTAPPAWPEDANSLDRDAVRGVGRALALTRPGLGRDDRYHDAPGFYARQFARNGSRALIGYSESLYYVVDETRTSCRKDKAKNDACLDADNLALTELPLSDKGSRPVAWVDALAIRADLDDQRRRDAEEFIAFMLQPDTYRLFLVPQKPGDTPRYLLPARADIYHNAAIFDEGKDNPNPFGLAQTYARLGQLVTNMVSPPPPRSGAVVRSIGKMMDAALPAGR